MPIKYSLQNGKKIWIAKDPLGTGAEGAVHSITRPKEYRQAVAKILYPQKRTSERRKKVNYLVNNPPKLTSDPNGHNFIIWPQMMLFDDDQFVGFIMPKAEGIDMDVLCLPKLTPELDPVWQKFDRKSPDAIRSRLILCSNLAKAISAIHSTDRYVIGDLKPENIKVKPNGLVSIIDLDSCQISENGRVLFPSKMNTPKYNPPEPSGKIKYPSWDLFIIGVIFYEILLGIHPFTGTTQAPYDQYNTPDQKIKHGLFPFGAKKNYFEVIPPPHSGFTSLPKAVRELFLKCFDEGIYAPYKRPKANDWINFLTNKPKILFFKASRDTIIAGIETTLSWQVQGAEDVKISDRIGKVEDIGSITLKPRKDTYFKLVARNMFGESEEEIQIKTFPTPVLESLFIPVPDFESRMTIKPTTITPPKIDLSIKLEKFDQNQFGMSQISNRLKNTVPEHSPKSRISSLSDVFDRLRQKLNL